MSGKRRRKVGPKDPARVARGRLLSQIAKERVGPTGRPLPFTADQKERLRLGAPLPRRRTRRVKSQPQTEGAPLVFSRFEPRFQ